MIALNIPVFLLDLFPGWQGPGARVCGGGRPDVFDKSGRRSGPELPELHPQGYVMCRAAPFPFTNKLLHAFLFLTPQCTTHANRGCYQSILSHFSFHKPIQNHMCIHTACQLMIVLIHLLTLTHLKCINKLKCAPQIMEFQPSLAPG